MEGNPASYEAVKGHLRQFASFARVKKYVESDPSHDDKDDPLDREWFYLVVDGKPKLLILGLQENCYRCEECGYEVAIGSSFDNLLKHMHEVHKDKVGNLSLEKGNYDKWREFDYVLVVSGKGHYEKNMLQVLADFNWNIIYEDALGAIGFKTPKQKLLIRKSKDHHKSFDFMMIMAKTLPLI